MARVSRKKVEASMERKALICSIVFDKFLRYSEKVNPEVYEIPYTRTILGWCREYYSTHQKAPGLHIQDLYKAKAASLHMPDSQMEMLEEFLAQLSEEYDQTSGWNPEYLLEEFKLWVRRRELELVAENLRDGLESGGVEELNELEQMLGGFRSSDSGESTWVDPLRDTESIRSAFEEVGQPLFTFPGKLGEILNEHLIREGLITFQGPEKRGKTFWLFETAIQALKARRNVALFQCGDLSKDQGVSRLHVRLAGKSNLQKYCGKFNTPTMDCFHNQTGSCNLDKRASRIDLGLVSDNYKFDEIRTKLPKLEDVPGYKPCTYCRGKKGMGFQPSIWFEEQNIEEALTWREAIKVAARFDSRIRNRQIRMSTYPNDTLTVSMIEAQLAQWAKDGYTPDVIVVDYADILAAESYKEEKRIQVDKVWKALRRLAQNRKALVATATQANAESYDMRSLKLKNFSESKTKYAHVTAVFALNQLADEKRQGIMRLAVILGREGEWDAANEVRVLQSLRMGRTLIDSF